MLESIRSLSLLVFVTCCDSLYAGEYVMNTRYLSRIGTLQLKPTLTFKHGGKASLAHKPKLKIRTTSKPKIKRILTFKDELDNVRIRTRRSPSSKDPEPSSHVNAILAADAFKDRIFRYTMKSCDDDDFTVVSFFKIKDKDGNLERGGLLMIFNFGPIRIGRYSNILRQAASTVARLLERWPHTLDFSNKQKKVLADVALERTSSNRSKIYPTIEFNPLRSIYWSTVNGIDPDSGESYSVFVGVRPKNITDFEVPETPKTERFALHETSGFHPQTVKDATQQEAPTSPISDEGTSYESKKREAAIKILQLVLWKYHSKILRLSDVQYATEEIVLKYAARTKGTLLMLD